MDLMRIAAPMKATALALIPLALALAGCESTSRFDGGMFGSRPPARVAGARPIAPEPAIAAPTAPVTAQPLPPITGSVAPNAADAGSPGEPPPAEGSQVAAVPNVPAPPVAAAPSPAPARPTARAMAGTWKI